jgi:formamidopyrimidine-DNA glycosylase
MPELPEVETVVRLLAKDLTGARISSVRVSRRHLRFRWQSQWDLHVAGKRIDGVRRRGKWILIDLDSRAVLLAHLGMSGQFRVSDAAESTESHTHLTLMLDSGHELRYRDPRRFGGVRFAESEVAAWRLVRGTLGPEPCDIDPKTWHAAIRASERSLKAMLLDQSCVAGVGNIYADESLFTARLPPMQRCSRTTLVELVRLKEAIVQTLLEAIRCKGTSFDQAYAGGKYQNKLKAYGRTGQPCSNCGRLIQCIRLAGRATHYCPKCQR